MKRVICIVSVLLLWQNLIFAQESINAGGGSATGAGGSAAFSIGQLAFMSFTDVGGSVEQGVEQSNPAIILPVTLIRFTAKCIDGTVQLNWQTATEIDNAFFLVERSKETGVWTTIAKLKGAGNSTALIDYAYADRSAGSGYVLYRLKQVDIDGHFKYSGIVMADHCLSPTDIISCYPNPVTSGMFLDLRNNTKIRYTIADMTGRIVAKGDLSPGLQFLSFNAPANAVYQLRLYQAEIEIRTFKIFKTGK